MNQLSKFQNLTKIFWTLSWDSILGNNADLSQRILDGKPQAHEQSNTHILRSALRKSQTKKIVSTMQDTGEMVFRIWGTKGRSRRAAYVCALRTRDAFPGNNRDKSLCAEPRIPRTCLWGYWKGSDRRKHPRLMSHFSEHNHLELCLLELSQIFSGFMQASSCRWQWMAGETKLWAAKYSDKRPGHDGNILTKGRGRMEIFWCERERLSMIYAKCGRICSAVHEEWEQWDSSSRDLAKEISSFFREEMQTYSSHCSHHSTGLTAFSLTLVWYFSFPKAIVTRASFVPFFPFTFRPFAFFTGKRRIKVVLVLWLRSFF